MIIIILTAAAAAVATTTITTIIIITTTRTILLVIMLTGNAHNISSAILLRALRRISRCNTFEKETKKKKAY